MGMQEKARNLHAGKVTEGRTKGDLKEVSAQFPEGVTIRNAEVLHDVKRGTDYAVVVFEETADKFYFCGSVITNFMKELIATYESKDAFDADLLATGLKVTVERVRSKNGNVYNKFTVL